VGCSGVAGADRVDACGGPEEEQVSFDIALAKTQVRAASVLALPYFLDACDEIARLRERECPFCGSSGQDISNLEAATGEDAQGGERL
jgi:hypothetical protein